MKQTHSALFCILIQTFLVVQVSSQVLISTDCGNVQGQITNGVRQFLGIPYAPAPIGNLRWKYSSTLAEAGRCWSGVWNASSFGDMCVQAPSYQSSTTQLGGGVEDCLFINIFAPNTTRTNLPVYVFIHGGGLTSGSSSIYDASSFIGNSGENAVFVSMNYRLGAFGWMSIHELSAVHPRGISGNYGTSDQLSALRWVKANIAAFGGNPNSVTLFGQSSGATSTMMLVLSPLARGLFHRAFLMSSSTVLNMNLTAANQQNRLFVTHSGCANATNVTRCLYEMSTDDVVEATPWFEYPFWDHQTDFDLPIPSEGSMANLAIVDGFYVPHDVRTAFAQRHYNDVPIVFGTTAQEIDLIPAADLRNKTRLQYKAYITQRLRPFGNPEIVRQALTHYRLNKYELAAELAYTTMASDIHLTCPQTSLAQLAATTFRSPIYRYVVTQRPSSPVSLAGDWPAIYSFHVFDLLALFGFLAPSDSNNGFVGIMQEAMYSFGQHGVLPSQWPRLYASGANHIAYANVKTPTVQTDLDYHKTECDFWLSNGFYQYAWNS